MIGLNFNLLGHLQVCKLLNAIVSFVSVAVKIPSCFRSIWLIAKYQDWIYKEQIPAEDLVKRDINSLFKKITQTFKYLTINDIIRL